MAQMKDLLGGAIVGTGDEAKFVVTGKGISASISLSQGKATKAQSDSLVLIAFSKLGINWSLNSSMNQWDGIEVENGRVTSIKLPSSNIKGDLPESIGRLTSLKYLDLSGNELSGNIPSDLGYMPNLKDLWLSQNRLIGEIPSSLFFNPYWGEWEKNTTPQQSGYGFSNTKSIITQKRVFENISLLKDYKSLYQR